MQIKSRYTSLFVIFLSITSTILSWDGRYEGGDIAGARRSFRGPNPIDLWGGFNGFFMATYRILFSRGDCGY